MKRLIVYTEDFEKATQHQAEEMGINVKNAFHGTDGYTSNGKWYPAEIIERRSVPYSSESEVLHAHLKDIDRHIQWLKNSWIPSHPTGIRARLAIEALKEYKIMLHRLIAKAK